MVSTEEFNPEPIDALTVEQWTVFDLYSQDYAFTEIAREQKATVQEIKDVINSVTALLETDRATATLTLLRENIIQPDESEVEDYKRAAESLASGFKEVLGAFVIAGTYEGAAELLGYTPDNTRLIVEDAAYELRGRRNMAEIARMAFVARLDEYFRRRQELVEQFTIAPLTEAEPEADIQNEEEAGDAVIELPQATKANIKDYLSWMYPQEPEFIDRIDKLSDEQLAVAANAVRDITQKYIASLKPISKRRAVKPAGEYINRWLDGSSIPAIANAMQKNEGTVRLSLQPFAQKVATTISPDEFIALVNDFQSHDSVAESP